MPIPNKHLNEKEPNDITKSGRLLDPRENKLNTLPRNATIDGCNATSLLNR